MSLPAFQTVAPGVRRIRAPWAENELGIVPQITGTESAFAVEIASNGLVVDAHLVDGDICGSLAVGSGSPRPLSYRGDYAGHPVWESGSLFLFRSASLGKWILCEAVEEPWAAAFEWEDSGGGEHAETVGTELWYELPGLPSIAAQTVQATPKGSSVASGAANVAVSYTPPAIWTHSGAEEAVGSVGIVGGYGLPGRYEPVSGTSASGSIRVGTGVWACQAGEIILWESADGEHLAASPDYGAAELPTTDGGGIVVASGAGGRWVAAAMPALGAGFTAAWEWAEGADTTQPAPAALSFQWQGLDATRAESRAYTYQLARLA